MPKIRLTPTQEDNLSRYIARIRNKGKQDYAYAYAKYRVDGGTPPEGGTISVIARQAVRMSIEDILQDR